MVTKYFGSSVTLRNEKIVDLAKQMIDKPIDERTKEKTEKKLPISPQDEQKIIQTFYNRNYSKFLDEAIPMIDNKTPRQASKDPKMRPKLVDLMKTHIKSIERINRDKGININIDWILDELGLSELK